MSVAAVVTVALAAGAGALVQRLSGIGFSLIAAPSLVLVTGPRDGVALTNLLAIVVALAVFATSAKQVDTAMLLVLVPAGLAGVVPGVVISRLLPTGPLQVAVGVVTGLGLAGVVTASRLRTKARQAGVVTASPLRTKGRQAGVVTASRARPAGVVAGSRPRATPRLGTTIGAGALSGFTTAIAGAGGPALTVYALATGWPQPQFASTSQLSYATQAAAALAVKGPPRLPVAVLGTALAAVLCGLVAGQLATARVTGARARCAAISLAALATLVTVLRGLGS